MKKWILNTLLKNEKFVEVILSIVKAAMDLKFTPKEWEEIQRKAKDAIKDLLK